MLGYSLAPPRRITFIYNGTKLRLQYRRQLTAFRVVFGTQFYVTFIASLPKATKHTLL